MSLKKSWVAVEEFDENVENADLMEVPSETLEADLVEIEGEDKDIEALINDGDELEHDQEQLDALTENAEASLEEDGMDETAARATEIAAEAFTAKWGVKRQKVGLESFASADGRRRATQVAIEGLKDAAVSMWDTFVKWLKELIAKAKDQLLKLTNAGKSLKKRAEKLEARLDKGLGVLDKNSVDGSWAKQLTVDEKFNYDFCVQLGKDSASVEKLARGVAATVTEANKLVREPKLALPGPGATNTDPLPGTPFGKKVSKKLSIVPQGATELNIRALPGNGYVVGYKHNDIIHTRFVAASDKPTGSAKIPPLDSAKCKAGIEALYGIGDALEAKLKGFRDANAAMDELVSAVESAAKDVKEASKDSDSEKERAAKLALKAARQVVTNAKGVERAVIYGLKNAGTGIAGYVAASIGAYKAA